MVPEIGLPSFKSQLHYCVWLWATIQIWDLSLLLSKVGLRTGLTSQGHWEVSVRYHCVKHYNNAPDICKLPGHAGCYWHTSVGSLHVRARTAPLVWMYLTVSFSILLLLVTYVASRFSWPQTVLQRLACMCHFGHMCKSFSRMDPSHWNCWIEDEAHFILKRSARLPSRNVAPIHASSQTIWGCFPTLLPILGIISHFNVFP